MRRTVEAQRDKMAQSAVDCVENLAPCREAAILGAALAPAPFASSLVVACLPGFVSVCLSVPPCVVLCCVCVVLCCVVLVLVLVFVLCL